MRKLFFIATFSVFGYSSASAQCGTSVLEAFGATSSLALYNTYITIGSIADGYVGETYDSEYTVTLMDEQLAMIDKIIEYIDQLAVDKKSGISTDDKDYLLDMKACLKDLRREAEGLKEYARDDSQSGSDKYNEARTAAWAKIEDLLGLGE